jgi:GTPase SAR1 family protein
MADIFLLCFSYDDISSFKDLEKKWYPVIKEQLKNDSIFLIIGNKKDIKGTNLENEVKFVDVFKLSQKLKSSEFCETSCKDNEGIKEIFKSGLKGYLIKQSAKNKRKSNGFISYSENENDGISTNDNLNLEFVE